MASTKDEITAIAVEHGYTGAAPKTIAGAIDALADTLAGEDVTGSRTIAGAIHALAPYIGAGGGGGFEPKWNLNIRITDGLTVPEGDYFLFRVDSRGPLQSIQNINGYGNVYQGMSSLESESFQDGNFGFVGSSLYVALAVTIDAAGDADKVHVKLGEDEIEDVMRFVAGNNVIISFQVPEIDDPDFAGDIQITYDGEA